MPESETVYDYTLILQSIQSDLSTLSQDFNAYVSAPDSSIDYSEKLDLLSGKFDLVIGGLDRVNENLEVYFSDTASRESFSTDYTDAFSEVVDQINDTNIHLSNVENILIPCMVGIGLVVGVLCTSILSKFFKV